MKYLLALAAVVWLTIPFNADAASYVAKDGENWVRIYDEPCTASSEWLKLKRAVMFYKGKEYAACWMVFQQAILVFDSEMDLTPVPMQNFKRDVEV
jgi:hypothetical protein